MKIQIEKFRKTVSIFAVAFIFASFGAPSNAMAFSDCSATPLFDGGSYIGCETNVDGHISVSDLEGLTYIGCLTFCSALHRLESDLMLLENVLNVDGGLPTDTFEFMDEDHPSGGGSPTAGRFFPPHE